jgi:hypothetical protein
LVLLAGFMFSSGMPISERASAIMAE